MPALPPRSSDRARLFAVSDLHVSHPENRDIVDQLTPSTEGDWLIVAGDVGEVFADIERVLGTLAARFARVIWVPGNHELWTHPSDPIQLRGEARYRALVDMCRHLGVLTPEDPYPVWTGDGGPAQVVPLFLLYDYSFLAPGTDSKESSLALAKEKGVVCTDEFLLHPDPYPTREAWCAARVRESERRLALCDIDTPKILVNHYPLVEDPTRVLRYSEFAQWCGTVRTAEWHLRPDVTAVVYGHLHIPRKTVHDGVPFREVSLGYPREWRHFGDRRRWPVQILPVSALD
ncbi:metallophosphoesterase family protein [Nocardiopsis sp. NPDC055551]